LRLREGAAERRRGVRPRMSKLAASRIAQDLVRINTVNPPGNELEAMRHVGALLEVAGFSVTSYELAAQRCSLIAELDGSGDEPPLCFTGHLDTVPLGNEPWSFDPFGGEIADGRLCGRGSTDMKGGIGAIVDAAVRASTRRRRRGIRLVLTAAEETGCEGAQHLAKSRALEAVSAIIVAEPTSNVPLIGHRGVLWLELRLHGRAAHGSTPERGDSALVKAASTISALHDHKFDVPPHDWLGAASVNVGYCHSGRNVNVVPDSADIGLDIRTIPGLDHATVYQEVSQAAANADITRLLDLPPVFTEPADPWFQRVRQVASTICGTTFAPQTAPYFTDASVLAPNSGNPPVIILGPGELACAHCVDEYCDVAKIEQAAEIFLELMVS
jgi:succinyl-diaminopimelate desuccinylase